MTNCLNQNFKESTFLIVNCSLKTLQIAHDMCFYSQYTALVLNRRASYITHCHNNSSVIYYKVMISLMSHLLQYISCQNQSL